MALTALPTLPKLSSCRLEGASFPDLAIMSEQQAKSIQTLLAKQSLVELSLQDFDIQDATAIDCLCQGILESDWLPLSMSPIKTTVVR